jgi:predicted amidohydrolase YtcJ
VGRSVDDLKPWLDVYPYEIIDTFKDKIIMPGFVDAHSHPVQAGVWLTLPQVNYYDVDNPYGEPFKGLKTKQQVINKIKDLETKLETNNSSKPLVVFGYDEVAYGEPITVQELDEISKTRPILVWDASAHVFYLNSAQISVKGITKDIGLDQNGGLNGKFTEHEAALMIAGEEIKNLSSPENSLKSIKYSIDLYGKNGITATSELAFGKFMGVENELYVYKKYFEKTHPFPIRIVLVPDGTVMIEQKGKSAINYVLTLENNSTDNLMLNKLVKFHSDDAFMALSMQMKYPGYIHKDKYQGIWNALPIDQYFERVLPWWQAGFGIHVHSNGNAGQDYTLDLLQQLQNAKPRFDHRFTFEHFGTSTADQIKKIKALGAAVNINPYYLYNREELYENEIGTDVANTMDRFGTLIKEGVITSTHFDGYIGNVNPLKHAWIAVTREGQSGNVLAPSERIGVDDALKMITVNGAYLLGLDDKVGSIETGKFADFTILEQDPYEIKPESLKDIPIWGTIVGGKIFPASEISPP